MIQEMLLEVCLMMRINQKMREKLIKVLARLSYKKVHCQPKCKAVFYLNNLNQTKCLTGIVKPKSEKSGLKSWIFQLTGGDSWGLGMQSPTSSALCIHRAELALLIATLMEHCQSRVGLTIFSRLKLTNLSQVEITNVPVIPFFSLFCFW